MQVGVDVLGVAALGRLGFAPVEQPGRPQVDEDDDAAPSLLITEEEMAEGIERLARACDRVGG